MPPEEDGSDRFAAGVDIALRYRAPLVEVILKAEPIGAIKVELAPEDEDGLFIFDGRRLGEWATAIAAEDSEGGRYVRRLADTRPLLCLRLSPPCPARLQGVCKDLQERLQGASTGFSAFPVDPTRADSWTCHSVTLMAPRSSA